MMASPALMSNTKMSSHGCGCVRTILIPPLSCHRGRHSDRRLCLGLHIDSTTLNLGGSKNLSYPLFYQGLVHRYISMHRVLCGRAYRVDLIYTWAEHTGLEPLASVLYHNHNETPTQMMSRKLFPYNFHRKENVRVQWSLTKITLFFSIMDSLFELFA